jgi:hypothetical protein
MQCALKASSNVQNLFSDLVECHATDFVQSHGFHIAFDPPKDGACQFAAISHQLQVRTGRSMDCSGLRAKSVIYMTENRRCFEDFITAISWEKYLQEMLCSTTHGDHLTLHSQARLLNVQVLVLSSLGLLSTALITPDAIETHSRCVPNPAIPLLFLAHSAEQHSEHYYSILPNSSEALASFLKNAASCQSQQLASSTDVPASQVQGAVNTDSESTDSDSTARPAQAEHASKKRTAAAISAPFKRCDSKDGFIHVCCTVCCEQKPVVEQFCKKRFPPIATPEGVRLRARDVEYHLTTDYHAAAVRASKLKVMPTAERQKHIPLFKSFFKANRALAKSTGSKLVQVYCDAKKGLSANSWPARYLVSEIASSFDPDAEHTDFDPSPSILTYVNRKAHDEYLQTIVDTEKPAVRTDIANSKAASIRIDGSVDRRQEDKKHVMLKFVDQGGKEKTIFLGK